MKRNIPAFFSGALTTALVGTIAVSALAASGRMTIEVDPVNVQVNGQVFVPTDANGKEVPVFAYNGTTYAPLRALAEAYGLEVGYDATSNMATVGKTDVKPEADLEPTPAPDTTAKVDYSDWSAEDEAAYQEFKDVLGAPRVSGNAWSFSVEEALFHTYADNVLKEKAYQYLKRLATECFSNTTDWLYIDHFVGIKICKENNNVLVGITGYSDKVILRADCIWDDFEFHIGMPTMDIEL